MRVVWLAALVLSTSLGCAPLEASVPEDGDKPCRTDADCTMSVAKEGPGSMMCSTRRMSTVHLSEKDQVACEPIANMTPRVPEPVLACFRGACVAVGSK
jgi:hypothetical protein